METPRKFGMLPKPIIVKVVSSTSNYNNLEEFEENHKFTITMEELESLVDNEVNLEAFRKQYCSTCGSQRCDGSPEWMEGCEKWRKYQNE